MESQITLSYGDVSRETIVYVAAIYVIIIWVYKG